MNGVRKGNSPIDGKIDTTFQLQYVEVIHFFIHFVIQIACRIPSLAWHVCVANRKSYIEFVSVWLRGTKVGRAGFGEERGEGQKMFFSYIGGGGRMDNNASFSFPDMMWNT